MKLLTMQSGLSIISEGFEPKPRRSIDPSTFNQNLLPPKPAINVGSSSNPLASGIYPKKYSKTPVSHALRTRSNSRTVDDVKSSGIATPPHNSTTTTHQNKRLNFEFNLEDHIKKTRQAGRYLKQIIHSKDCSIVSCPHLHCARTKQILSHVQMCVTPGCKIPGCQTTKRLLDHAKTCHNSWYKIHATTTAQRDFCLLCTIAHCEENHRQLHRQPSYSYEDTDVYQMNEKDAQLLPMISDEIIEFSRVPFQSFPVSGSPPCSLSADSQDIFSPRAKTYSDSNFDVSMNEPNKKLRSKSWAVPSSPSYDPATSVYNRTPSRNIVTTTPFSNLTGGNPGTPLDLLFPKISPVEVATEAIDLIEDQQVERMNSLISTSTTRDEEVMMEV